LIATSLSIVGLLLTLGSYEQDIIDFNVTDITDSEDKRYDAVDSIRFTAWYNVLIKYIVMITSFIAIGFLLLRRYQKIIWINNYLNDKYIYKKKCTGNLNNEYNGLILETDNVLQAQKPYEMIKHKKLCNFALVFEIIVLLIFPIPFYDKFVNVNILGENGKN